MILVLGAPAVASGQPGTVSTIAGTGENTSQPDQGNLGDGGPALSATMFQPRGIAVASDGTVYFADTANFRVRRIRTDGVIETIAGSGVHGDSGHGVLAVEAQLSDVLAIALDPTETFLYLADDSNNAVRRVNLATGVIEHIAQIAFPQGIAVDSAGQVLVSETVSCVIRRVDPSTGNVTNFAGNGVCDSLPGTVATASFLFPTRLSIDGAGNVYVVEAGTDTVRRIDAITTQVTTVAGGGSNLPGAGPATSFNIGIVTDVTAGRPNEIFVSNETRVFRIDLTTGLLDVYAGTGIPDFDDACTGRVATECNFNNVGGLAIHEATGRLLLSDANNARIRAITPPSSGLSFIGTTLTTIDCPPGLTVVPGNLTVSNNASATVINCGAVERVAGDVNVNGNGVAEIINLGNLAEVDGGVTVQGNVTLMNVDLGALLTVDGSVIIRNNPNVETINLGNLTNVTGDVTITGNGHATIDLGNLALVDGDVTIESHSTGGLGTFIAGLCAQGSTDINATGYATVLAITGANGSTSVTSIDDSSIRLDVQPGTFSGCVDFSLSRVVTAPEAGTDADGDVATIDPVDAYQIAFNVPVLGHPATLTFDITLANLNAERQTQVIEALNQGILTLITKQDNAGATYQSFRVCEGSEAPTVDGCVALQTLDANGNPTTGTPAIIRFTGIVGHFSTWGVAIVTPVSALSFNGLLQPYPAPPHTTTPTFKRGSVVPLRFNWTDSDGVVVDSAIVSPALSVYIGTCASEGASPTLIVPDDAGQSDGWRYDEDTRTWIFGWNTRPLAAGCYWIQITTSDPAFPAPASRFPIVLRDR